MLDLIRREDAINEIENAYVRVAGGRLGKCILTEYTNQCRKTFSEAVRALPAVENVEHVRHGKWIFVGKTKGGSRITRCSYCGEEGTNRAKSKFCRDCGAKMDLEEIEELITDCKGEIGDAEH